MADFIADARAGRNITVKGDGTPVRSYLHASDMTTWLWKILLQEANMQIFNVGSEEAIRLVDLAKKIGEITNTKVIVLNPPRTGRGKCDHYTPITQAAVRELSLSGHKKSLKTILLSQIPPSLEPCK